jgi:hypothetical protein
VKYAIRIAANDSLLLAVVLVGDDKYLARKQPKAGERERKSLLDVAVDVELDGIRRGRGVLRERGRACAAKSEKHEYEPSKMQALSHGV